VPTTAAELRVLVGADVSQALSGMKQVAAGVTNLARTGGKSVPITVDAKGAHAGIAQVRAGLSGLTTVALGVGGAIVGLQALAAAPKALASALGVDLAIELENTTARLNAVTKDAAVTERILGELRTEADATPFGFAELAKAYAALHGPSKQFGLDTAQVLKTAEVLAAVNPAQGMEGAAFAIRQALGGQWESVLDRFDLDPAQVRQLREAGVAPIEIINRALAAQGFDATLIDKMAQTFEGRLSTFEDAIATIRLEAGKPILKALTGELERFTGVIGASGPQLREWAANLGANLAEKIRAIGEGLATVLVTAQNIAGVHNLGLPEAVLTSLELRIGELFGEGAQAAFHGIIDAIKGLPALLGTVKTFFDTDFKLALETVKTVAAQITAAMQGMVAELKASIAALMTDLVEANIPGVSEKFRPAMERLRTDANFPPLATAGTAVPAAVRGVGALAGTIPGVGGAAEMVLNFSGPVNMDDQAQAERFGQWLSEAWRKANEAAATTAAGLVGA
jgi:hypothetical protein